MIANEVNRLERENRVLKEALEELSKKMEKNQVVKPKSCQYCKHYIQHYMKDSEYSYRPIYFGHCTRSVPIYKGGKKKPTPEDTCQYFEIGTSEMKYY